MRAKGQVGGCVLCRFPERIIIRGWRLPANFFFSYNRLVKDRSKILFAVRLDEEDSPTVKFITKFLTPVFVGRLPATNRFVVPVSRARLTNGLQGTAAARFGIKGLHPSSDCLVWNILVDYEYETYKYPSTYIRADQIADMVKDLKFMDNFNEKWQCITKLAFLGLYAGASLFNFTSKPTLGYWCRYLSEYASMLLFQFESKLKELTKESTRQLGGYNLCHWGQELKDCLENKSDVFFRYDFFERIESCLIEHFMLLCGCVECRRMFIMYNKRGRKFDFGHSVRIQCFPMIGSIRLPAFLHLGEPYDVSLSSLIAKDLGLSMIEGQIELSRLPISLQISVTPDKKALLTFLTNIVFIVFVVNTLYRVINAELDIYYDLFTEEVGKLCVAMEEEMKLGRNGCLGDLCYFSPMKQMKEIVRCPGEKSQFILKCWEALRIGFSVPAYKDYDETPFMEMFFMHHLHVKRFHEDNDRDLVSCDNLIPGFFIVNTDGENFLQRLQRVVLPVAEDYLTNTRCINGTMAFFFSGLKYFGSGNHRGFQISPEKDVRAIAYKLGSLDVLRDDYKYYEYTPPDCPGELNGYGGDE